MGHDTRPVSAGLVTLAACGGGGSGGDAAPATTSVTVSPSLGKFSAGAKVTIKKIDDTVLGSGNTTAAGTAVINVGTYSGAMLVEVSGAAGVKYFDEGTNNEKDFGSGETLTAVAPSVTTALGVTPATRHVRFVPPICQQYRIHRRAQLWGGLHPAGV